MAIETTLRYIRIGRLILACATNDRGFWMHGARHYALRPHRLIDEDTGARFGWGLILGPFSLGAWLRQSNTLT